MFRRGRGQSRRGSPTERAPRDGGRTAGHGQQNRRLGADRAAVLIATSPHMLERALPRTPVIPTPWPTMPGYALMRQRIPAGAQNATMLNLPSILEALRP